MHLFKKGSTKVLINMHWYGILPLELTKIRNSVAAASSHPEGCLQESVAHVCCSTCFLIPVFPAMLFCCVCWVDVPAIRSVVWEVVCSKQLYLHWYVDHIHVNFRSTANKAENFVCSTVFCENQPRHGVWRASLFYWLKKGIKVVHG